MQNSVKWDCSWGQMFRFSSTAEQHMLPALAKKSNRSPIWAMYRLSLQREKAVSPQQLHMRQWMPCKIRHIQMFRR